MQCMDATTRFYAAKPEFSNVSSRNNGIMWADRLQLRHIIANTGNERFERFVLETVTLLLVRWEMIGLMGNWDPPARSHAGTEYNQTLTSG
jgi:hypothetical protein